MTTQKVECYRYNAQGDTKKLRDRGHRKFFTWKGDTTKSRQLNPCCFFKNPGGGRTGSKQRGKKRGMLLLEGKETSWRRRCGLQYDMVRLSDCPPGRCHFRGTRNGKRVWQNSVILQRSIRRVQSEAEPGRPTGAGRRNKTSSWSPRG